MLSLSAIAKYKIETIQINNKNTISEIIWYIQIQGLKTRANTKRKNKSIKIIAVYANGLSQAAPIRIAIIKCTKTLTKSYALPILSSLHPIKKNINLDLFKESSK